MKYMRESDSALFFTCSLIEFIGRQQKLKRSDVVSALGENVLRRIYNYSDVLHCEPIAKCADDFITECGVPTGDFDNVGRCVYTVPSYWDIGKVYCRLIEDVQNDDTVKTLKEVYSSWIDAHISNYNTDFFYQPRDYIKECYLAGEVLDD